MSKKSFVLFKDLIVSVKELEPNQQAELFMAILNHQNGEKVELTGMMKALFAQIKNQFDRDDEKYLAICKRNQANGIKGGRAKNPSEPKRTQANPVGSSRPQSVPVTPDTGTDTDTDTDIEKIKKNKSKKKIDIGAIDKTFQPETIIAHRANLNKPLRTTAGVNGIINALKRFATHYRITYQQALNYWQGQEWSSIKIKYGYEDAENNADYLSLIEQTDDEYSDAADVEQFMTEQAGRIECNN